MHSFIKKGFRGKTYPVALVLASILIFQFAGCKDSGSVGGGISGPDSDLVIDTMQVNQLQVDTVTSYSGNRTWFSVGQFQDPLFGTLNATGLINPS